MYTSKKTTTVFSASTCYVTATTVTACTRRKKKSIIADLYDEDADISENQCAPLVGVPLLEVPPQRYAVVFAEKKQKISPKTSKHARNLYTLAAK